MKKEINEKNLIEEPKEEVVSSQESNQIQEKQPEAQPQVEQEPEDKGIFTKLYVNQKTLEEFYIRDGFLGTLKRALIYAAVFALIVYLFYKKSDNLFQIMGIVSGCMFGFELLSYCVQKFILIPKQFKKNDLNSLNIDIKITNKGITQYYQEKEYKVEWANMQLMIETNNSFLCYCVNKSGFVISKEKMTQEQISYISKMAEAKVFNYKNKTK